MRFFQKITFAPLFLLALLPLPVLYLFSDILYVLLYYVLGYRKAVVQSNLKASFPEKSSGELLQIQKEFYKHLADLFVESIKMLHISRQEIAKRCHFTNPEFLDQLYEQKQSAIAVIGHQGNWEWGGLALALRAQQKVLGVYKPLSNRYFNNLMLNIRSQTGMQMVPKDKTIRSVLQYKNECTITALIADQSPTREESDYWTKFLNQDTLVFLGPEKLAKLTGKPVFFCKMTKLKRGHYAVEFIPLFSSAEAREAYHITNTHVALLEQIIKAQPAYWLWSHKRWKHKKSIE